MANNQIVIEERAQLAFPEFEQYVVSQINSIPLKKEAVKLAKEDLDRLLDEDEEYRELNNAALEASKRKKEKLAVMIEENEDIAEAKGELTDARDDLKSVKSTLSENLKDYKKRSGKDSIKVNEVDTQILEINTV